MAPNMGESGFKTSANFVTERIHYFLKNIGISESWINILNLLIVLIAAIAIVFLLQKLIRYILTFVLKRIYNITRLSIFNFMIKNRLPHFAGLAGPYTFVIYIIPTVFSDYHFLIQPALKMTDVYLVLMIIWIMMAVVKSFTDVLQQKREFRNKPMQSYVQIIRIIFYMIGAVAIFSILTEKSVTVFFTAMGAASAVLLLMFKDTIMGFVASIQISTNQMVMLGDWITLDKYGADGTVEEINLTTVKIRNFDKTITTVPTYSLISDSFQNWRGMEDSGGRRLKRSIIIKQSDIKTLTDEELTKYEDIPAFSSYIEDKRKSYSDLNKKLNMKDNSILKGYQITNCDLFIRYATWYLRSHPDIHEEFTLMVRQLAPTIHGLPIEIYAFANTTAWSEYERIAGEIINHLISNVRFFELTVFESVAGTDSYHVSIRQDSE